MQGQQMPSTAPDDTEVDPGEEMTPPKASAPKPSPEPDSSTPDKPAAAPGTPEQPAPLQPTGSATREDVVKSFAAQGYGAPSADYTGPALPLPKQEPEVETPEARQSRYHDAYKQADAQFRDEWSAQNPFKTSFEAPSTPQDRYQQAARDSDAQVIRGRQQAILDQQAQDKYHNDQREAQMRGTGQKFFRDSTGRVQPIIEPSTGRPIFNETPWGEGVDPKTGQPSLTKTDRYGQRQFKTPQIVSNPDLTDNQLYYKMPDGSTKPAGKVEDLVNSPDFGVARTAKRVMSQRRSAEWKQAIEPMEGIAADASSQFDTAKEQHDSMAQQSAQLDAQIDNLSSNPALGERTGGILGFGSHPTDASMQSQAQLDALQKQKEELETQAQTLGERIKPGGDLFTANRRATLNLQIFKAKAKHDSYADLADERRLILKQQGIKDPENDPTLQSILQAQSQYRDSIDHFSGIALRQVPPNPPKDQQQSPVVPAGAAPGPAAPGVPPPPGPPTAGPGQPAAPVPTAGGPQTSAMGAFGRAASTGIIPMAAAAHGFEIGAAAGLPTAAATKGFGPLVTGLLGAGIANYFAEKGQSKLLQKVAPNLSKQLDEYAPADAAQHPVARAAGNFAAAAANFEFNPMGVVRGAEGLIKAAAGNTLNTAEKAAAMHLLKQSGLGAMLGVVDPLVHGEKPTLSGISQSVAQMVVFGDSRLGSKAAVQHIDNMFPQVFWKNTGMDAATFAKEYPDAVRRVASNQATPEDVDLVQRVNAAAKAAGVKVGDLARGRMVAQMFKYEARGTQKVVPESLRPDVRKDSINFQPGPKAQPAATPGAAAQQGAPAPTPSAPPPAGADPNAPRTMREERAAAMKSGRTAEDVALLSDSEVKQHNQTHADQVAEAAQAAGELHQPANAKDQSNATTTGQGPGNDQQQHPGTPQGPAVPKDEGQPRQGNGAEAGGRDRAEPVAQKPEGVAKTEAPPAVREEDKPGAGGTDVADANANERSLKADEVSKFSGKEFVDYTKGLADKGGYTTEAYRLGEAAKGDDAQIQRFAAAKQSAIDASKAAMDKGDMDEAMGQANKSQFFSEAHGAATGTGSAGEHLLKKSNEAAKAAEATRVATKHGEVQGEKINNEWTQFGPETKGLGIPRAEMPQVKAEHRGALTQFLKAKGIEHENALVYPKDLKPSQNEYSPAKVRAARRFPLEKKTRGQDRSILVSADNHVVDGHHQWVAKLHQSPSSPMRVIRLKAPIHEVLSKVKEFPSTTEAGGKTPLAGKAHTAPAIPVVKENAAGEQVIGASAATEQRVSQLAKPKQIKVQKDFLVAAAEKAAADAKSSPAYVEAMKGMGKLSARQMIEKMRAFNAKNQDFVTFEVPGDGTYRIHNNKEALEAFAKKVKSKFGAGLKPGEPAKRELPKITKEELDSHRVEPDIIDKLNDLKIHTPGKVAAATPFSLAWDGAIDAAILGVKAGRTLQKAVVLAMGKFHEKFPGASREQARQLQRALAESVKKLEETRQKGKDFGTRLKQEVGSTPKWDNLTSSLANFEERATTAKLFIEKDVKEMREDVPSREAREGISAWLQADGDKATLEKWRKGSLANPKTTSLAPRYERALSLKPEEIAVAKQIKDRYAKMLARGQREGILGEGLENFVNNWWDVDAQGQKFAQRFAPQLTQFFASAMKRTFPSSFEGEQAGMTAKSYDISELYGKYMDGFERLSNTRKLIKELTNRKAADGRPLAAPTGAWQKSEDPETGAEGTIFIKPNQKDMGMSDYRTDFGHPALNKWKWVGEEDGKPVVLKGSLALHPDAFVKIKNAFSQSALKDWYRSDGGAMMELPKSLAKLGDWLNSTTKGTALGFLSPFHQVQEGTHAIGHRINPFQSLPPIEPWKNARQRYAMQHGLMLGPGSKGPTDFMEGLANESNPLYKIPGFGEQAKNYTSWLFGHYIPSLKMQTWEAMMERNSKLYAGKATPDEIAYLSAIQANSAYGHLNYTVMGRNPTIQHIARLLFLSPDFTEARGRFVGQAAQGAAGMASRILTGGKKGEGASKAGAEQLHALAFLAMTFYFGARLLNAALNDGDTKTERPFQVYHNNRWYGMRSVPEDVYRMFKDSRMFFSNRLSPITRFLLEGIGGHNARGEKIDFKDSVKDMMTRGIPNSVQWIPGLRDLSEYGAHNTINAWEQFAGIFGVQIQRASAQAEAYKLANDFRDKHGDKTDTGVYPVSKYQSMRYELEDSTIDRAKTSAEKLIKDKMAESHLGRTEATNKVAVGFREALSHTWTQDHKMDESFLKSLDAKGKTAIAKAELQRRQTWIRFCRMMGLPITPLHPARN